jgi:hypothetical protein
MMLDVLWGVLIVVIRAIDFILDILVTISRLRSLSHLGDSPSVKAMETAKGAKLKILGPAAQRALDEAGQRRRANRDMMDKSSAG